MYMPYFMEYIHLDTSLATELEVINFGIRQTHTLIDDALDYVTPTLQYIYI